MVSAEDDGSLMLNETRGCGKRERELKEEMVTARHEEGSADILELTMTTIDQLASSD